MSMFTHVIIQLGWKPRETLHNVLAKGKTKIGLGLGG